MSPCFSAFLKCFRTKVQVASPFSLSHLVACKSENRNSREARLVLLSLAFSSAVSADAGTCSMFLCFLWFCLSLVAALSSYPAISTALLSLPCYVKTQKWLRKHLNLRYLGKQLILEANATYTTECLRFLPCRGDVMPHLLRLEGMHKAS